MKNQIERAEHIAKQPCDNCDGLGIWPSGILRDGTPYPGGPCIVCDGTGYRVGSSPRQECYRCAGGGCDECKNTGFTFAKCKFCGDKDTLLDQYGYCTRCVEGMRRTNGD